MTTSGAYDAVPERAGQLMLTDTGVETDLIFHQGVDLPHFAAFVLADSADGRERISRWHRAHAQAAVDHGHGVALDALTWRASSDWGDLLGYDAAALDRVNRELVAVLHDVAGELDTGAPVRVGGTVGPRSDGYAPTLVMTAAQARDYHRPQVRSFADAGADRVTALTLGYAAEAAGFALAASDVGLPAIVGFTLETDGRLPDGTTLRAAIEAVDAAAGASPAGYLVNCAHPDHVGPALEQGSGSGTGWQERLIGLRPNASRRSHAELDEAADLDDGDPDELAAQVAALRAAYPSLNLLGGCCGTDLRHARALASALATG